MDAVRAAHTGVLAVALFFVFSAGGEAAALKTTPSEQARTVHKKASGETVTAVPWMRSLSLRDRVAQLIVVRGYGDYPTSDDPEYRRFERWIKRDHVGGFIVAGRIRDGKVIGAQPFEMAQFINHMQRLAKTPLLVGSDFERGAAARVAGTADFPYLMAFGAARDLPATRELGVATAREARSLGVNWIFAPDADVNNNPDNPIINTRSYGEDPQTVAAGIGAFIDGAHSDPKRYVLVAAKHFPGHGDTSEDSHIQLAKVTASKMRMESVELVPFRSAIAHKADAIMTAHLAVPAIEPQTIPATVSSNILSGLLKDELGFQGIVVTDALEMQAVAAMYSPGESAVRAIEAGADVLLMPTDPEACIRALVAAVTSGRLSRKRVDQSVAKILLAKRRVGLVTKRAVNLENLSDELDRPRLEKTAQQVAERAVTLVKDDKHLFPMPDGGGSCLIVMAERQFSQRGETMTLFLKRRIPDLRSYVVDPSLSDDVLRVIAADASHCKQIYVGAFVTVSANRGSVALEGGLSGFLRTLSQGTVPVALISLGNPYLLRDYQAVSAYAATFSTTGSSELAAARAMLGDIPIGGKMPVSIPGVAKIGDGLTVPAKAGRASNVAE